MSPPEVINLTHDEKSDERDEKVGEQDDIAENEVVFCHAHESGSLVIWKCRKWV